MNESSFPITREKHLDHLVKVVPLITVGYGIQAYVLSQMDGAFSSTLIVFMGLSLVTMICGMIFYDVKQQVILHEDHLEAHFLGRHQVMSFADITAVEISDPQDSFGTVHFKSGNKTIRIYFVDNVGKIKTWIESRKVTQSINQAA